MDLIKLLSGGIAKDSVTDSVDKMYPPSTVFHILMQDALEIFQLIWEFKALRCVISGWNLLYMQVDGNLIGEGRGPYPSALLWLPAAAFYVLYEF